MRLEAFITDLLFEHDCVVVPGFGGLVANYRTARLNRNTHLIHPPSKHIGFNRNLVSNDGLLVHHVASIMGVSYAEALARVEESVANYRHALMNEGRLVWEKIGVFFKDKSGQIQFIPEEQENFLLSSFGLSSVQLKYVAQEPALTETPVIPIETARRTKVGVWKIAAAAAIPLLIGGALLLRNQLKSSSDFSLASFNPFEEVKIVSGYEQRDKQSTLLIEEFPLETLQPLATTPEEITPPEPIKELVIEEKIIRPTEASEPKEESTTAANTSVLKGKHAVIGGAFKVKANAKRFLKKLKSEGFDAQFAGVKDGMTLVAYGVYDTNAEADNAMQNLLSTGDVRAWVKHY